MVYHSTARLLQDSTYEQSLYTDAQELTLIVVPYFSAPLSIVGSGLILYVIWKERQTKLIETYHRLMLGLSSMNFMNSLGVIVLGHWVIPSFVDMPGASGTTTTCSIAGFFLNLLFGSMWYSFFLSLCFALRIKCECRPRCIARYCETIGHFLGFFLPILTGAYSAAEGYMNPMEQLPGWCWTTDFPNGCSDKDNVECIRGEDYETSTEAGGIIFLFSGITICMGLITLKVRRTELRMREYAGSQRRSLQRTKQSGVRALWYIGVFFIVYFPIAMLMILGDDYSKHSQGLYFAFAFLTKLLSPLQGFLNAIIYFQRNFRTLQQEGRSLSFIPHMLEKLHVSSRYTTSTTTASIHVMDTSNVAGNNALVEGGMNTASTVNEGGTATESAIKEDVTTESAIKEGVTTESAIKEGVTTESAMEEGDVKSGAVEEADTNALEDT